MAENKLIPTTTVVEERPPEIDIITWYEKLFGLPHTLQAFIGMLDGEHRNNVEFKHGDGGLTMKNHPERIDYELDSNGELVVFTDSNYEGDADNYYIDAEGYLNYFFPDIPFHPSDITEFQWGLDFGVQSDLTLSGDLINSITHMIGSTAGTWSATGTKRPLWLPEGAAQLDGSNDELLANFVVDRIAGKEIFIVAKKPIGVESYFVLSGRTWVGDGDSYSAGVSSDNKIQQYESAGASGGTSTGRITYPDGEYGLYHYKNTASRQTVVNQMRYNGFLEYTQDISGWNDRYWYDDHGADPLSELTIGRRPKNGGQVYFPSTIKEILYFSNLSAENRKCVEVYLKYKHNLPIYERS